MNKICIKFGYTKLEDKLEKINYERKKERKKVISIIYIYNNHI